MPIVDCKKCIKNDICIYSKIKSEKAKEMWNELKRICYHKNGDFIFQEGDNPKSFFIVCSGKVKIFKNSGNGNFMIISIKPPGSMFGYSCMCREDTYIVSAKSMENTTIATFPKDFWVNILKNDFDFSLEIMRLMCIEIGYLQTRLAHIAYHTAEEKVASVLLNHIRFTTQGEKEPEISQLKRTDIAELCGLRIETVVRTLKKFESKKIIKRSGMKINILNMAELLKFSSSDN